MGHEKVLVYSRNACIKINCIFFIKVHKRKYDESVNTVNANKSVLATGGADGIVKLFRI